MSNVPESTLFDYHKHNLVYIGEYIKFADQKAGVAITLNIALVGFFFNYIRGATMSEHVVAKVFLIIGVLTLLVSTLILLFKVLWPRYTTDVSQYMSWGGIASFNSSQDYSAEISSKTNAQFLDDMAQQNYFLGVVCLKKYKSLQLGLLLFAIGTGVSGLAWLFDK
ncbi:Pycsar system effector family protein [Priestia megaterium]|uniref:Pycsar system effector family protein n=1 Tax=Priestia megaterium TaxID=1404 RepID=UPI00317DD5CD